VSVFIDNLNRKSHAGMRGSFALESVSAGPREGKELAGGRGAGGFFVSGLLPAGKEALRSNPRRLFETDEVRGF
jgi:hypothetical protein